ncbi:MFS transporter [Actinoplanes sp. NPDC051851]|uniref:MFS transporter n=1 Tax=Actinoplanes sp. NPDC051851 TaxID=3154753 RepID=UPI00341BE656
MDQLRPGVRRFWALLGAHAILVMVVSYALRPALSYAVLDLGYGSVWPAVLTAAFAVPPLILALTTGRLVDRVGERPGMLLGAVFLVVACLVAWAGARHLAALIVSTALLGVGIIFSMVGEQSAVAGRARAGGLDSTLGVYTFLTSLGQMLGPLLLLIPPRPGSLVPPLPPIALACAVASVLILLTSCGFGGTRTAPVVADTGTWSAPRLLGLPGMWRAMLVSGLILASIDVALAYLPALVHARGIAPYWLTAMLAARAVAQMLSRINLGRLSERFGRRGLTMVCCAVSALALGGLTVPAPIAVLIALAAVYGFTAGVCQPLTMAWVTELAPSGTRGTVLSLRLAGNRIAQTLIPAITGAAAATTGVSGVLMVTGATLGVAAWSAAAIPRPPT